MPFAKPSLAQTSPAYGLFPVGDFCVTTGEAAATVHCGTNQRALWVFRHEAVALPHADRVVIGAEGDVCVSDDPWLSGALTALGALRVLPELVWIGARDVLEGVRLDARCERLLSPNGSISLGLVPRLISNRAFFNDASAAFFSSFSLRLRGTLEADRFVARTFWPEEFRLNASSPCDPIDPSPEAIRQYVRDPSTDFSTRLIWQRTRQTTRHRSGRPLIGMILSGAQGDDDEAHGGHFALLTGRVGRSGDMHDWLVANFYALDTESEKGILASMLPLENCLADLNSGQSWYRPSWMTVAVLRDERTALHLSSALAREFKRFYEWRLPYDHVNSNCAGISISTLRKLGWKVPALGATSWSRAAVGLPLAVAASGRVDRGRAIFDYYSEEQTRLFPALAFEQAAADLLRLVSGKLKRQLSPFEELLKQDIVEVLLVRIPQFPSSRASGSFPVASLAEYQRRLPKDPLKRQIIPLAPRQFPSEFTPPLPSRRKRSDYALALCAAGLVLVGGWLLFSLWRRSPERARMESRDV